MTDDIRQWAGPIPAPDPATLADTHAITQLAKTYALGNDMRDLDLVLSAFDPEGEAQGTVGTLQMREYLTRTYQGAAAFEATQHTILNQYVTIDGDEAVLWSYGVAYHIRAKNDPLGNLTVGVHYRDRCRRTDRGWLIYARRAVTQWIEGTLPTQPRSNA